MTIDNDLTRNERLLRDALTAIETRISDLYVLPKTELRDVRVSAALQLRAEIANTFAREFGGVISETVNTYNNAARLAAAELERVGISGAFTQTDTALIDAMMRDTRFELEAVSATTQAKISEALYVAAIAGTKRSDVLQQVRQLLVGGTDARGLPMKFHAETIMRTGYMETYTVVMLNKSLEAGIKQFKYSGATVRDSRPWCVSHVGKVYSYEEIQKWRESNWAGKKSGDPFVVRGGWNCIHRWTPYVGKATTAAATPTSDAGSPDFSKTKFVGLTEQQATAGIRKMHADLQKLAARLPAPSLIEAKGGMYYGQTKRLFAKDAPSGGSTFLHEYGHHLDFQLNPEVHGLIPASYASPDFMAAIAADKELNKLSRATKIDEFLSELYTTETRTKIEYGQSFEYPHYVLRNDNYGGISDIVDAITGGRFQSGKSGVYGHGIGYFRRDKENAATEIFANMTQLRATPEWAVVEKFFPNLAREFDALVSKGLQ